MSGSTFHGTYVGPLEHLKGKTALVRRAYPHTPTFVAAQFDDTSAERDGVLLGWNWHPFVASDFVEAERVSFDDEGKP